MTEEMIIKLGALPFDGNALVGKKRGAGSRRDFIYSTVRDSGLSVEEDCYGNLWVPRGSRGEYRLYSSHMDVDASTRSLGIERTADGYRGVLDNAVGCYLNLMNALQYTSDQRAFYVFTASEEELTDTEQWGMSARDVVAVLNKKGIKPSLCVAVDVTYPRLLVDQEEFDRISDEEWDAAPAFRLFDLADTTHCYVDGFAKAVPGEETAKKLVRSYNSLARNQDVRIRDFAGYDEAAIYGSIAPSFAVGPVGYGKYTDPMQKMPVRNVETAQKFLRFITDTR